MRATSWQAIEFVSTALKGVSASAIGSACSVLKQQEFAGRRYHQAKMSSS